MSALVQRVVARDVLPGDVVDGRIVEYVTHPAGRRSGRVIKFVDGGRWVVHHAEKIALVRPEAQ